MQRRECNNWYLPLVLTLPYAVSSGAHTCTCSQKRLPSACIVCEGLMQDGPFIHMPRLVSSHQKYSQPSLVPKNIRPEYQDAQSLSPLN